MKEGQLSLSFFSWAVSPDASGEPPTLPINRDALNLTKFQDKLTLRNQFFNHFPAFPAF